MKRGFSIIISLILFAGVASLIPDLLGPNELGSNPRNSTTAQARSQISLSDTKISKRKLTKKAHHTSTQTSKSEASNPKNTPVKGTKSAQIQGDLRAVKRPALKVTKVKKSRRRSSSAQRKKKEPQPQKTGRLLKKDLDQKAADITRRRGTLVGVLESISPQLISGYAYDFNDPQRTLNVQIFIDGELLQSIPASQPRTTGQKTEFAKKAFEIGPIKSLADGRQHVVEAFAYPAEEGSDERPIELSGSPRKFGGPVLPIGRIETVNVAEGKVIGWALDPAHIDQALEVKILWDGQSVGRFVADKLSPAGFNPDPKLNKHWFEWSLPKYDSQKQHTLQVFVLHSAVQRELDRSPWVFNKAAGGNQLPTGHVTFANTGQITGWALDPDFEDKAIFVDLFVDGQFLERQLANNTFAALTHLPNINNPNHLWIFNIPDSLKDGKEHSLSVFAVNQPEGANPELAGSPKIFRTELNNQAIGYVDHVSNSHFAGWAYDADAGARAVEVEIWIDGSLWKVVGADKNRQDLVPVVCPEATHGWYINAPEVIKDGQFHVVRVYARNHPSGSKNELARSPWELGAKTPVLGLAITAEKERGLRVTSISTGSAAAIAGILKGDVIIRYNENTAIVDTIVFERWIQSRSIGEEISLVLERETSIEVPLTSSLPMTIKKEIEAFELQIQTGSNPVAKSLILVDGRKVQLENRGGLFVQSWSERGERTAKATLK
jgi:hypothetical protein